jgi:hypothetical protein
MNILLEPTGAQGACFFFQGCLRDFQIADLSRFTVCSGRLGMVEQTSKRRVP